MPLNLPAPWPDHPEQMPPADRLRLMAETAIYLAELTGRNGTRNSRRLPILMWHERQRIFPETDPGTQRDKVWMDGD